MRGSPRRCPTGVREGDSYLFSPEFLEDLPRRLTGPGRFRFVFQPPVATLIGVRAGRGDARAGRPPYILSVNRRRSLPPWLAGA
jgi:hypothetical protein